MTHTQTIDPRHAGFNYGAPVPEPTTIAYSAIIVHAERLRKLNSERAQKESWHLDMMIRDVRHSCSADEQAKNLACLYRWAERELPVISHNRIAMIGDTNIADGGIHRIL